MFNSIELYLTQFNEFYYNPIYSNSTVIVFIQFKL